MKINQCSYIELTFAPLFFVHFKSALHGQGELAPLLLKPSISAKKLPPIWWFVNFAFSMCLSIYPSWGL